jgi:hypothetical protein
MTKIHHGNNSSSTVMSSLSSSQVVEDEIPVTAFEFDSDAILALAFLITAIVAAKRSVFVPYFYFLCACDCVGCRSSREIQGHSPIINNIIVSLF